MKLERACITSVNKLDLIFHARTKLSMTLDTTWEAKWNFEVDNSWQLHVLFVLTCVSIFGFRFNDSLACFHEEEREGLVKICRLALHKKYPKYATEGFEALYSRPPVIYISSAARPGLGQYVCSQVRKMPCCCLYIRHACDRG